MANIKVGEALRSSGSQIESMATTFNGILADARNLVHQITANWQGQAQVAFLNDFNRTDKQLESLPDTVKSLGQAAIGAADAYIAADKNLGSRS
ncbi:MAG: WXG100 family type VII secretion target [Clostridia bacterium]|jgi:WXG100 family type VII secretion target|nr:WXG100 family type VII secretion target [Clostridia bacterium]